MTPEDLLNLLASERSKYAEEWGRTASCSDANGDYEWMSEFLDGYERVLEIGVGDGTSTQSLLARGHTVVGVDSNDKCLETAYQKIGRTFDARLIHRESWHHDGAKLNVQYAAISEDMSEKTTLLINGDVTNDVELQEWLLDVGPFDAVVCWLIGTNMIDLSRHCEPGDTQPEPHRYRCKVQNRVYELSDEVLRPGGILHIVDRLDSPTDDDRDGILDAIIETHQEQASVTRLTVDPDSLACRPWHNTKDGVTMKRTSDSGESSAELILVSTISRKAQ